MFLPLRPTEQDRMRVVDVLKRGYVAGRLSTETFEARLVVAQTAPSRAALRALLADLSARWLAASAVLGRERPRAAETAHWAVLLLTRTARRELVVGRSRSCDLVFATDTVSRRHAHFGRFDGEWHVTDLGSLNGTFVDDVRVDRAPVAEGSRIRLGEVYLDVA